ncbi:MAG: mismatch repair endonuclease MutL, partial [Verrucomicrobiota bacterium]
VENSLDAGATQITVEIGAGGRSLIRVTDDGFGMSRDDALLCLERHATSKITRAEDLQAIETLGFRGEALPSIASVSRFHLTTRERGDTSGEGTQVVVHGGRILEVKAGASATGTAVEVRQLFFNLPARRKFLRSEETERTHIAHYLNLVALAHPQVGFRFISDARTVFQWAPVQWSSPAERFDALQERLRQILGGEVPLLRVDFSNEVEDESGREDPDLEPTPESVDAPSHSSTPILSGRVWGFIGAPGVSRSSRADQHLFVNQRPIESRGLNFALLEGYHNALMKGRYPVCCLFLEVDPASVDVNVHPQKREVRFRNESIVRGFVTQAVRRCLLDFARPAATTASVEASLGASNLQTLSAGTTATPEPPTSPTLPGWESIARPDPISHTPREEPRTAPASWAPTSQQFRGAPRSPEAPSNATSPVPHPAAPPPTPGTAQPLLQVPLRIVGVIGRLYVLLESDRGLVLMDQHAAHERILYEQMLARMESAAEAPSQRLLMPETVEMPVQDAHFTLEHLPVFRRLGVELREFGDRTFLLESVPPFVRTRNPRQFVLGLIDELRASGGGINTLRFGEDVVAKTVCRHAVKANDPLAGPELEQLLADLRRCTMPYTCPHGRPTLIEFSWRELERKFGRTG